MTAYIQGSRGPERGLWGREHPQDHGGHAQPPSPRCPRGALPSVWQRAGLARCSVFRGDRAGPGRPLMRPDPKSAASPNHRPSPPRPRGPAVQPRPPAARFYGNGRAPEQGRHDEPKPPWLISHPHRHGGRVRCSAKVPAPDAAQQHRVWGEAGQRRPKHLSAPETAAHTATERSAQAHSELAPPNLGCSQLLEYACARAFRVHLHGRQSWAKPAGCCHSSAL